MLETVARNYNDRVVKNGFRPYFAEIANDVKKIWAKRQWLPPCTALLRMPGEIEYWEPHLFGRKDFYSVSSLALAWRAYVKLGLTETLLIQECWLKDKTGEHRIGEMVGIWYLTKEKMHMESYEVKQGKQGKYLASAISGH